MKVKFYKGNKIDREVELDPDELAEKFMATLRGEKNPSYKKSGRLNLEFEYRWFLTSPTAGSLSWDEENWPRIWQALWDRLDLLDEDGYSAFIALLG